MKFKLGVSAPGGARHDVSLSCDVTTTVADAAQALVRSKLFAGSGLDDFAQQRRGYLTLIGRGGASSDEQLLDPATPIGASGLQSGWQITVTPEFASAAPRSIPIIGTVEVLDGPQEGAMFSLIAGANTVGRDPHSRVFLEDRSVSRRHAVVEIGEQFLLRDLGSANGVEAYGQSFDVLPITRTIDVKLGEITLRITPLASQRAALPTHASLEHRYQHTRAPRVDPRFPVSKRELPKPPNPSQAARIPLLAMLAPMLMGGVLYLVTRSPMSLIMVAFTPMMMIGSWVDNLTSGRRKWKRGLREFSETLEREREQLERLREQEIQVRAAETPSLSEVTVAIRSRSRLLWARRPEHRSFLELRFGDGTMDSRTQIVLPSRGEANSDTWNSLQQIEREFAHVSPVPVLERLDRCGSIGVSGEPTQAANLARALVLQLVGLHSPAELVIAAFAGSEREGGEWDWLKWLPHIDPVGSPIAAWQLADTHVAATRLLISLEALIEQRRTSGSSSVRSSLQAEHSGEGSTDSVDKLPPIPAIAVLVLESEVADEYRSRLIALAEDGPDLGIHVIWVAPNTARVPAACRTFVELGSAGQEPAQVSFVRFGQAIRLTRVEQLSALDAVELARSLAPVDDTAARAMDESDLPRRVNLRELHPVDLLGGPGPILQSWHAHGSIVGEWKPGEEQQAVSLASVIGQGPDGPVIVDLRTQGPHALVGGTTGSGKSEFLQSWIMSLAANISPDRLTFLLVDYKGGAAFAECVELPHTVGLVTDLSPRLVRRALTSLRAELRYREELLAERGAKDLLTMEQRGDAAAPPALIIVIDEFAALANEVPEFVDGVIDIAQRGRSLGLHLIMATQRPAGVIKDNLRANTNLRVALRMADESDSADVIGVKDAAYFDAETPGRAAIKTGAARISHFQTGYLGGRSTTQMEVSSLELRDFGFVEGEAWDIPGKLPRKRPRTSDGAQPARDIERLRDALIAAAESAGLSRPRRPWLDMLPPILSLETVKRLALDRAAQLGAVRSKPSAVPIGMRDRPDSQTQDPVTLDLDEAGNLAIFGASGTGKTSALLTIAAATSEQAASDPVHLYAIDAAGGGLDALESLPTVGAVARLDDSELVRRVLLHLRALVSERGSRFASKRAHSLSAYRAATGEREARVVLLLDGFSAFRQVAEMLGAFESPMQMLSEIMQAGRAVGVHVVLTADRAGVLPSTLSATVQQQIILRLASANDYSYVDVPNDMLENALPGRAVFAGQNDEIQLALLAGTPELLGQAQALDSLGRALAESELVPVPIVRNAPESIELQSLAIETKGRPVYGINTQSLEGIGMPISGLGVIAGPAGSGLSTAVLGCTTATSRWAGARGESVERCLLTFVPDSAGGLGSRANWDQVAHGAEEIADIARKLIIALGGRPPSATTLMGSGLIGAPIGGGGAAEQLEVESGRASFPEKATRGIIVVERPTEAEGTEALPLLVALAKAARRADVLVLFEFEQSAASGVWDLFSALKQPPWGLALQPDEGEGGSPFRENFGRVKRADFVPGRGFAIEAGRVTPIHVALPGANPRM